MTSEVKHLLYVYWLFVFHFFEKWFFASFIDWVIWFLLKHISFFLLTENFIHDHNVFCSNLHSVWSPIPTTTFPCSFVCAQAHSLSNSLSSVSAACIYMGVEPCSLGSVLMFSVCHILDTNPAIWEYLRIFSIHCVLGVETFVSFVCFTLMTSYLWTVGLISWEAGVFPRMSLLIATLLMGHFWVWGLCQACLCGWQGYCLFVPLVTARPTRSIPSWPGIYQGWIICVSAVSAICVLWIVS